MLVKAQPRQFIVKRMKNFEEKAVAISFDLRHTFRG
jgi:hypothetical protein